MENNILIILTTVGSIGVLGTFIYLILTVRNLKNRLQTLASEMIDFHTEFDHYQVNIGRRLDNQNKDIDIELDRMRRKIEKTKEDINASLPFNIRKTIEHIEFAQPLDKK